MRIVKTDYIGRKRSKDIQALIRSSNTHDGTRYGMIDDADGYALAYGADGSLLAAAAFYRMGEKLDGREVCELAAFTAPEYRGQHLFTRLAERLSGEMEGAAVRFAVCRNEDAAAVLKKLGAVHEHDELLLEAETAAYTKTRPETFPAGTDLPEAGEEAADSAGLAENCGNGRADSTFRIDFSEGRVLSKYSECYFRMGTESAYVFGVLSYDRHRRKGHARAMLSRLFAELNRKGIRRVMLQVSSDNLPALRLYESLGMQETDRLEYHLVIK